MKLFLSPIIVALYNFSRTPSALITLLREVAILNSLEPTLKGRKSSCWLWLDIVWLLIFYRLRIDIMGIFWSRGMAQLFILIMVSWLVTLQGKESNSKRRSHLKSLANTLTPLVEYFQSNFLNSENYSTKAMKHAENINIVF